MGSLALLPGGLLTAAWQAADDFEGWNTQRLLFAVSSDGGATWGPASTIPGRQHGVMWSPALFQPSPEQPLHVFYAESHACWRCEVDVCTATMLKSGYVLQPRPEEATQALPRRRLLKHGSHAAASSTAADSAKPKKTKSLVRMDSCKCLALELGSLRASRVLSLTSHIHSAGADDGARSSSRTRCRAPSSWCRVGFPEAMSR